MTGGAATNMIGIGPVAVRNDGHCAGGGTSVARKLSQLVVYLAVYLAVYPVGYLYLQKPRAFYRDIRETWDGENRRSNLSISPGAGSGCNSVRIHFNAFCRNGCSSFF